jgi:hypothetical protein
LQNPQANVTGVSASWTVPTVNASATSTYSSIWIGIGGADNDTTLIQCGTEQDYSRFGITTYSAWYELLPENSVTIESVSPSPGDQIQACIELVNVTSDQWVVNITDTTSNQTFQNTFIYNSSQLTADWVVERPTVQSGPRQQVSSLADFGDAIFTNCTATIGSSTGDLGSFPWQAFAMYSSLTPSSSAQLAVVSDLTPDGSSFTVTWLASG